MPAVRSFETQLHEMRTRRTQRRRFADLITTAIALTLLLIGISILSFAAWLCAFGARSAAESLDVGRWFDPQPAVRR